MITPFFPGAHVIRHWLVPALLFCAASPLNAMSLAGRQNRREFVAAVTQAFVNEDYGALESTAAELRAKKDRFPDGMWTLPAFYDALDLKLLPTHVCASLEERLARWQAAFPNSAASLIVELNAIRSDSMYELKAGVSTTPGREARAQAALEAMDKSDPPPGPDWHNALLRLAMQQGSGREAFDRLFDRAVAAEPDYLSFYFNKANYLRSYGVEGEWEAFALDVGRKNPSGEGMGMYSRIAWSMSEGRFDGYLAQYSTVQWPLMRDGFRELDRLWPGSEWNLNNFCRFACLFDDRATARELFARIDDDRWTTNWLSRAAFKGWRDWAAAKENAAELPALRLVLKDEKNPRRRPPQAWTVAFAPDSGSLFVGYDGARLVRWELGNGAIQWQTRLDAKGVLNAIATSPDGRWLAAGVAARNREPNVPGALAIWDLRAAAKLDAAPTRRLEDGVCGVHMIRFSPDSQMLAKGGLNQVIDPHGEVQLWTVADWKRVHHDPRCKFPVPAVAFVGAKGSRLAYPASAGFNVVDAATWAHVFWPDNLNQHDACVFAIAASPDGKTLACGTSEGFEDRDRPGEIAFWDTDTWTRRPKPHVSYAGGVGSVTYSADGRWVLAGGYDGILRVWDAATGKATASWPPLGKAGKIDSVAFSPDGRWVATARSEDEAVSVYRFDPTAKE